MDDLPWDLVFYGSMAIIFVGIIAASRRARRDRREEQDAATRAPDGDASEEGGN